MGYTTEIGKVIETDGARARVRIRTSEGCKSCAMKESCLLSSGKEWKVTAVDEVGAAPGDTVRLSMRKGNYLASAAGVFLLPLACMVIFYLIGVKLLSEGFGVLLAFIGLAAGMGIAWKLGKGKGSDRFRYRVVEKLGGGAASSGSDARQRAAGKQSNNH